MLPTDKKNMLVNNHEMIEYAKIFPYDWFYRDRAKFKIINHIQWSGRFELTSFQGRDTFLKFITTNNKQYYNYIVQWKQNRKIHFWHSPIHLYLIFEKSSLKLFSKIKLGYIGSKNQVWNQVRPTWFLKKVLNSNFSKIKYRWIGR